MSGVGHSRVHKCQPAKQRKPRTHTRHSPLPGSILLFNPPSPDKRTHTAHNTRARGALSHLRAEALVHLGVVDGRLLVGGGRGEDDDVSALVELAGRAGVVGVVDGLEDVVAGGEGGGDVMV